MTTEPLNAGNLSIQKARDLELAHFFTSNGGRSDIVKVENIIKKYPEENSLKNNLSALYNRLGMVEKSVAISEQLLKDAPDYLFARTNVVLSLLNQKKPDFKRAKSLLGAGDKSIRSLYPDRVVFHQDEVTAYYSALGNYLVKTGDVAGAKEILEILLEAALEDHVATMDLGKKIFFEESIENLKHLEEDRKKIRSVESFPTVIFPKSKTPPLLHHEELKCFYEVDIDSMEEPKLRLLIELPRETLILDLLAILEDSIRRFEVFENNIDEFDESTTFFPVHSIFFLGALEAEPGLQCILNIFRQGEGFLDFWFGDFLEEFTFQTIFALGKNRLDELKAFVLEPNIASSPRLIVVEVLVQFVLHEPARREEVLDWFRDMLRVLLDNPDDETRFDNEFLSFLVGRLVDIRAIELLSVIEEMFEKGWIFESICGKREEIIQEISLGLDPHVFQPQPQNIFEFYSQIYKERGAPRDFSDDNHLKGKLSSKVERYLLEIGAAVFSDKEEDDIFNLENSFADRRVPEYANPVETYKRESPRIGRNDPCPCGSGKKYKKCCWNKRE